MPAERDFWASRGLRRTVVAMGALGITAIVFGFFIYIMLLLPHPKPIIVNVGIYRSSPPVP